MLIVSRKTDQAIRIKTELGTVVTVRVCSMDRGVVRLGIEAPRTISILRDDARRGEPPCTDSGG